MLPKKLFLSTHSHQWSDIVIQHFRTDHLQQNSPISILTCGDTDYTNDYMIQINTAHMNVVLRAAMQSDILFLDMRDTVTQLLIEYLSHVKMQRRRIICVSSILCWANTHSTLTNYQGNLQALSNTAVQPLTDSDFSRRIPSRSHQIIKQLEDRLLNLQHDVTIVSCGLVYGRSYQQLSDIFEHGLRRKQLTCHGDGNNIVPLIHVDDLGQLLCRLTTTNQRVVIAAHSQITQMELLKKLQKQLGLLSPILKKDVDPQTTLQELLAMDISVTKSQMVEMQHSLSDIMKEFTTYREYEVKRYRCKNSIKQLSEKYMAIPLSDEYIIRYLQMVQKGQIQDDTVNKVLTKQDKQTKPQSSDRQIKQRKSKNAKSVGDIGYSKQMIHEVLDILLKQYQYVSCIVSVDGVSKQFQEVEADTNQDTDRVSILKGESEEQPQFPKLLSKDSRRLSIKDREARKVVMNQYLLDVVMPRVSECIAIIESTKPPNIMKQFIRLMREEQSDNFI